MATRFCRQLSRLSGHASLKRHNHRPKCLEQLSSCVRWKSSSGNEKDLSSLIQPLSVKPKNLSDDINVGAELAGELKKKDLLQQLNEFFRRPVVKALAAEDGLDNKLFHQVFISFRKYVMQSQQLDIDLHIVLSDILQGAGHVDDIYPYFLRHAREMFPHLECMEDLKKISDLRLPANWYPEARAIQRKIVFHAGPTNSGKTYHALQRFLSAKSGVYCGPLKLLAAEVFNKSNAAGTQCDLVTGEERRYVKEDSTAADHVACTVEMTSVNTPYEVAIIDEIQMMRDPQRGWAWTRALLGICAHEIHLCGEASSIDLVQELAMYTGDELEVRRYKRLTKLQYLDKAVETFENVRPGDCIVCFSKNDIYYISRKLEALNQDCAVIYGGLPPGTKLAQAERFNNPNDPCKIMVATDAIGMGLNLAIKRIVFYTLMRPHVTENGEKEMDVISTSQALQIAGRAGRYNTAYENGEVTTFRTDDLHLLQDIVTQPIDPIEQAGLHPTAEQVELFAYHLPHASLSNLIDIFIKVCELDSDKYFMCNMDDFKFLADMIQHVPLSLRVRYVFCCSPIPKKQPFVCAMFLKFTRQFSTGSPLTLDWLCRQIGWPIKTPRVIADLVHLEGVFDILDLYLWLGYRFPDMFPDAESVRDMQQELDQVIQAGVIDLMRLIKAAETKDDKPLIDHEDEFEIKYRQQSGSKRDVAQGDSGGNDDSRPGSSWARNQLSDTQSTDGGAFSLSAAFLRSREAKGTRGRGEGQRSAGMRQNNRLTTKSPNLSEQLVQQGLISRKTLNKLHKEWRQNSRADNSRQSFGRLEDGDSGYPDDDPSDRF